MLQTGDLVFHFSVTNLSGESFDYSDIWQRKNLVLVSLPHAESAASTKYVAQVIAQMTDLTGNDTACVITRDSVSGVPSPGVVVADRWGEIHHVTPSQESTITRSSRPDRMAPLRAESVPRVSGRSEVRHRRTGANSRVSVHDRAT